jgi:AcrR family transcriptional regulator
VSPGKARRLAAPAAREVILAAAATVLARKGYYGGTIEDVAREAGYSPSALYKHFAGRDELFAELWTRAAAELDTLFARAVALEGSFHARLRWLVQELARLLETRTDLLAAFISQRPYVARRSRSDFERRAFAYYRRHMRRLEALMREGVAEGELRPGASEEAALLFVGLVYELAYRWITATRRPELLSEMETLIRLFEQGVGHRGPAPGGA